MPRLYRWVLFAAITSGSLWYVRKFGMDRTQEIIVGAAWVVALFYAIGAFEDWARSWRRLVADLNKPTDGKKDD